MLFLFRAEQIGLVDNLTCRLSGGQKNRGLQPICWFKHLRAKTLPYIISEELRITFQGQYKPTGVLFGDT